MEEDVTNRVNYYLKIDESLKKHLAVLRSWENVKVGIDKGFIWLTNFTQTQIESVEVKIVPSKTLYYSKNNKLYLFNSLLPDCNEPSFLWTPIQRAFALKAPSFNHNYFGIKEAIEIKLIEKEVEEATYALLTSIKNLESYVLTAPEYRLSKLEWTIIDEEHVLIIGLPTLPISGKVYWREGQNLLPVGYDFELNILVDNLLGELEVNSDDWLLWKEAGVFSQLLKENFKKLSLSSVRKTCLHFSNIDKLLDDAR